MRPNTSDGPARDPVEEACELNDAAVEAFHEGRADEAEEAEALLKRALRIRERLFGAENVEWAMTANNLGVLYREQGRLDEAERLLTHTSPLT